MKKFVIERILPGARIFLTKSYGISREFLMRLRMKWTPHIRGYGQFITEDKIFCIHIAGSKGAIREHSKIARFPIHTVNEVKMAIDPYNRVASEI